MIQVSVLPFMSQRSATKNISNLFIKSEDLRILEKGIDLETPKKYTFALVEEKWVFKCRDFSKIAVLFC